MCLKVRDPPAKWPAFILVPSKTIQHKIGYLSDEPGVDEARLFLSWFPFCWVVSFEDTGLSFCGTPKGSAISAARIGSSRRLETHARRPSASARPPGRRTSHAVWGSLFFFGFSVLELRFSQDPPAPTLSLWPASLFLVKQGYTERWDPNCSTMAEGSLGVWAIRIHFAKGMRVGLQRGQFFLV